ncbi:MAG: YjfB family protein [Defluviitaleaceae bacterium]|nr:YjfB family protein [Defluviitaleaceae bacterium]
MDIPKLSMQMAQADLMQQLSVGMMKRAIEMTELNGEMLADMMDGIPDGSTFSARV